MEPEKVRILRFITEFNVKMFYLMCMLIAAHNLLKQLPLI